MDQQPFFPSFSLEGRKALVTGASRGIGRALALGLAHAGALVSLTARDQDALAATAREIQCLGQHAVCHRIDVTDLESIGTTVAACARAMGGLDILVNNAGIERVCDSLELTEEIWDTIVNTNLKGAFFCSQAAARIMVANGGGSIINICSLTSSIGVPTAVPYTSSKTGLLGMTRALAAEWAKHDIRVNAIAPGYFRTDMTEVFFQDRRWADKMKAAIPLGRFGRVQDLIGAVVFLAGQASEYVSGQMLTIDGGYLASI